MPGNDVVKLNDQCWIFPSVKFILNLQSKISHRTNSNILYSEANFHPLSDIQWSCTVCPRDRVRDTISPFPHIFPTHPMTLTSFPIWVRRSLRGRSPAFLPTGYSIFHESPKCVVYIKTIFVHKNYVPFYDSYT